MDSVKVSVIVSEVYPCYNDSGCEADYLSVLLLRRLIISVVIRNYHRDDLTGLIDLIGEVGEGGIVNELRSGGRVRQWLGHPNSHPEDDLFLAESGRELAGYAVVQRELEVGRVILGGAVHPIYQGQGIGSRLMEAALTRSEALRVSQIRIPISSTATEVRCFVQK